MYDDENWEVTMWDRYCDEEDEYFEREEERLPEEDEVIEDPYPEVFEEKAPPCKEVVFVDKWNETIEAYNDRPDTLDEEEKELLFIFRNMSRREKTLLMARLYGLNKG